MRILGRRQGSILIFALWVLAFLVTLVVQIGLGARQKIHLLQRLEARSKLRLTAEAGIKTAVAVLTEDAARTDYHYTPIAKKIRHHNPEQFRRVPVGDNFAVVSYEDFERAYAGGVLRYGAADEEAKLNINVADVDTLERLVRSVLGVQPDAARGLAEAIVDWRSFGTSSAEGFYSEGYYNALQYPYKKKSALFEAISELLLVRGVDMSVYDRLKPFVTVYGNGLVNINTASVEVLMALGLEEEVAGKVVDMRSGPDRVDDTDDDHIFYRTYDIAAEVNEVFELKPVERTQIDTLNALHLVGTDSEHYTIRSQGYLESGDEFKTIETVYNVREKIFLYWYEK